MGFRNHRPELDVAALTLGAWVAFGLLEAGLAQSVASMRGEWGAVVSFYVAQALLWAALSPLIAAWDRLLRARLTSAVPRLLAHVPTAALAAVVDATVRRALVRAAWGANTVPFSATLLYYADLVAVSYAAVVVVADALGTSRALAERRRVAGVLEAQVARARLEYLDAQLQPHFLFNSLSAVSELAHEAPLTAARVLRQLASLLRSAFGNAADQVTLGQELVALEPYLEIQRIRYTDWLDIVHDVDDRAADCIVPRLMLQPLVENAIRHGVAGRFAPGCIVIQARVHDGRLIVRVRDNGVGLRPHATNAGRGIGLTNLRERLAALHGDRADLRLYRGDEGTVAELALPAERAAAAAPAPDTHPETSARAPAADRVTPREYSTAGIVLAWVACGLLWTQQSLAYAALRHRLDQTSWTEMLRSDLAAALLWAGFTLAIIAVARRFPVTRTHRYGRVAGYLAGGVAVSAGHILLNRLVAASNVPLVSQAYASLLALNVVIYWVVVAIAHRRQLARWSDERVSVAERLATELTEARTAAMRLRVDPDLVLAALERLAVGVVVDRAGTERGLARLADYLRLSIDARSDDDPRTRATAVGALASELESLVVSGAGAA